MASKMIDTGKIWSNAVNISQIVTLAEGLRGLPSTIKAKRWPVYDKSRGRYVFLSSSASQTQTARTTARAGGFRIGMEFTVS